MGKANSRLREKVEKITGKTSFIVPVIIVNFLLSIFAGQLGTLLFYVVVFVTLWARRWDWKYFGITRPNWPKTVFKACLFTGGIFILIDLIIQPLVELQFGKIVLSSFSGIEGNLLNFSIYILLGWLMGGVCEEIIYRGYALKRLAIIFGDTKKAGLLSAAMVSIVFGFAHRYQGPSGMITTAVIAMLFGLIFIFNKNNLMVLVLTHGIYNMIAITLIYLGKERMITDWVHAFIK